MHRRTGVQIGRAFARRQAERAHRIGRSIEVNPQRADELLKRAVELEAEQPTALRGQLDFAFAWLTQRAIEQQRFIDALHLLRQQAARTRFDADGVPTPVAELFALLRRCSADEDVAQDRGEQRAAQCRHAIDVRRQGRRCHGR